MGTLGGLLVSEAPDSVLTLAYTYSNLTNLPPDECKRWAVSEPNRIALSSLAMCAYDPTPGRWLLDDLPEALAEVP